MNNVLVIFNNISFLIDSRNRQKVKSCDSGEIYTDDIDSPKWFKFSSKNFNFDVFDKHFKNMNIHDFNLPAGTTLYFYDINTLEPLQDDNLLKDAINILQDYFNSKNSGIKLSLNKNNEVI